MRIFVIGGGVLGALLLSGAVRASAQDKPEGPTTTLRTGTRLVAIPVVVRDKKGALLPALVREDFALAIDKKPQAIRYFDRDNDLPLTLGLMVDTSMSQQSVIPEERAASVSFLHTMLEAPANRQADKAFVLQFDVENMLLAAVTDSQSSLSAGLGALSTPCDRIRAQYTAAQADAVARGKRADDVEVAHGIGRGLRGIVGTTLFDAVYLASTEVMQDERGRKALILITDGGDVGSKKSMNDAIEAAQRADTVIYAIYFEGDRAFCPLPRPTRSERRDARNGGMGMQFAGGSLFGGQGPFGFGGGEGRKVLRAMSEQTGGRMFEVTRTQKVDAIYAMIGEELRSQYRLGYSPGPDIGDGYHKIVVTVPTQKKVKVQARDGYYAK